MTTLLISDLHLHAGQPDIAHGFLNYLETEARHADTLYLLGDIFEAWIGDDYLGDLERQVIDALKRLSDAGTQIYFMHGNRDFLVGNAFADAAGATLLDDPSLVALGNQRVLLMHGDSLCTGDEEYMKFRAKARDPEWQAQILALPVEQRLELAKSLRLQSSDANTQKADAIMDVTPSEVEAAMRAHGVTTLIHGHTHRPAVHDFELDDQSARRIVLGDWQPGSGWEIRVEDDAEPQLREFAI
ncbi:UDP-2,3-diacylglucosamine diphosphatase [Chromohalobacter canadensis]|uniref:UDP-2,3-diacylglucosamine hydrolase n=1 Tax=Chromohalobacter canadensis TaxID=141389 RepID=A0ABZ0YDD4_9GAMM|nr:UDP-2,3-diacylglucosamine diphosphatase [Chromohalobacter canadensis]MCK0768808.1 UDP-2,3-diacylglucosamine diphosphatase [Chromohalobacter canadensis]WQH09307.1 UDP-2,3-diacylglucosamine diphosphatase [Chromohalobacter canadensis]